MRKTQKQIKQILLNTLLNDNDFFNNNAFVRKTKMCHKTVRDNLPEVWSEMVNDYNCYKWLQNNAKDFSLRNKF